MRLANINGRVHLEIGDRYVDVAESSGGALPSDPMEAIVQWDALAAWAGGADVAGDAKPAPGPLQSPVPRPRQVFGISMNYPLHVEESTLEANIDLEVFTKFPSCIGGPGTEVPVISDAVDWEVELVVAMGRVARNVSQADAWDYVGGLMVGQDVSDRSPLNDEIYQRGGRVMPHQFCLDKSWPCFGPVGPVLVSLDEFDDHTDLEISCWVNGELMQRDRTSNLVWSVPALVEQLSRRTTLLPGDLFFTGSPGGVGHIRKPPQYLKPGDVVRSQLEGVGTMENTMVAGESVPAVYETAGAAAR